MEGVPFTLNRLVGPANVVMPSEQVPEVIEESPIEEPIPVRAKLPQAEPVQALVPVEPPQEPIPEKKSAFARPSNFPGTTGAQEEPKGNTPLQKIVMLGLLGLFASSMLMN